MKITGIIWLDEVVAKVESKHHLTTAEVEEVLSGSPEVKRMEKGHFRGEDVYRALGRTMAGRYVVVFFIRKQTGE
ncbi:MAG: BrnT family toxin, partial [Planctomycetes bacterium]|nr:BrnT family toxin [Planctomycetota bacterium]